jgi:DNA-binding HxlR family transcriptional regulator
MPGYGQFCPVAVASEVVAERWTPLVLRELMAGARRFNDVRRGLPLISRTLLAQRLRQLEDAGVIVSTPLGGRRGRDYRLTPAGEQLRVVIDGLGEWGQRWAAGQFDAENLDTGLLMWNVRRGIAVDRLPAARVVVRVDFTRLPPRARGARTWWIVLARPDVDLCLRDPGFEVDLVVRAELPAMARVWMGKLEFAAAVRAGSIRMEGDRRWARDFPGWLLLSPYAPAGQGSCVS